MFKAAVIGITLAVALGSTAIARPAVIPALPAQPAELLISHDVYPPARRALGHYKHKRKFQREHLHMHDHGYRGWHRSKDWRHGHGPKRHWRGGHRQYDRWSPPYYGPPWGWY